MDVFSTYIWSTHRKYYKRSRKEVWEFICLLTGLYIFAYCLACHVCFGIWIYVTAEKPKFLVGPVFYNFVQGLRFIGVFNIMTGCIGFTAGSCLLLGIKLRKVKFLTATTILLNLVVFLDVLVIILQILYWDKIAAVKIFLTVVILCWFTVFTYRKIVIQELTEKAQRQLKINPFHSNRF